MDIDLNTLRAAVTLLSFIVFAGIVYWALARKNKARFDEAANLPFTDDNELPLEAPTPTSEPDPNPKEARRVSP